MYITGEPPSTAAKFENYGKFQKDAKKRILDDRPSQDNFIAPIALLFQSFGYFRDIRCGVEVPGEGHICEGELRGKADALADAMTLFYKDEGERRSKFLEHLERIFSISSGSIGSTKISGSQVISDGHVNGIHGAMVFCIECQNDYRPHPANPPPSSSLISLLHSRAESMIIQSFSKDEGFPRWELHILVSSPCISHPHFFIGTFRTQRPILRGCVGRSNACRSLDTITFDGGSNR